MGDHAPLGEHIAVIGDGKGPADVLFDKEHGNALFVAAPDGVEVLLDQHGRQPDRRPGQTTYSGLIDDCRWFEQKAKWTQNDNIGLWFGQQFKPRQLGMLGYVAINSPTLKCGLRNLVDMFPYHQQATLMRLADADGDGLLKLEYQINDGRIVAQR